MHVKHAALLKLKHAALFLIMQLVLGLIMLRVSIMLRVDLARLRLPLIISLLQSNLDYPDLDYPDFSIIRTFSLVPFFHEY